MVRYLLKENYVYVTIGFNYHLLSQLVSDPTLSSTPCGMALPCERSERGGVRERMIEYCVCQEGVCIGMYVVIEVFVSLVVLDF